MLLNLLSSKQHLQEEIFRVFVRDMHILKKYFKPKCHIIFETAIDIVKMY